MFPKNLSRCLDLVHMYLRHTFVGVYLFSASNKNMKQKPIQMLLIFVSLATSSSQTSVEEVKE